MPLNSMIVLVLLLLAAMMVRAEDSARRGEQRDEGAAVSRLESKAQAGDATAQNNLGVHYLKGRGVIQDPARARALFEAAAEQHLPGAMFNLGTVYWRGYGVAAEPSRALEWFQRAAALDDREAQFSLGVMYTRGQGTPSDLRLAEEWFEKAANAGMAAAQFNLAMLLLQGSASNEAKALEWLEKAAEQGYKRANLAIAKLDLSHDDDPARMTHAATLLRELAHSGDPEGQMQFGLMNLFGKGLPLDEGEGRFWLRESALQGLVAAQVSLSSVFAQGIGTAPDPVEAHAWLSVAAERDEKLKSPLTESAAALTPEQRDHAAHLAQTLREKLAAHDAPTD